MLPRRLKVQTRQDVITVAQNAEPYRLCDYRQLIQKIWRGQIMRSRDHHSSMSTFVYSRFFFRCIPYTDPRISGDASRKATYLWHLHHFVSNRVIETGLSLGNCCYSSAPARTDEVFEQSRYRDRVVSWQFLLLFTVDQLLHDRDRLSL